MMLHIITMIICTKRILKSLEM
ncbi:hypothetical protein Gorai_016581 [Gossypium raimondii]|uniref:Uncharacterized protein n=1 Tax=Gossypium raimondii TaxID=29730 RepID=A0A7J8P984_GOSRA|nr:hypothetical protein [Gossypium raimondii]